MLLTRRSVLKLGAAASCVGLGVNYGYNSLKAPLVALDEALNSAITDLPAASISAAIFKNRQVLWSKDYGFQDIASRTPMTSQSAWQSIGSISKLVVWTAIMQLVEQGKVELDEDISRYLGFGMRSPYFPDSKITTRHLITHTSSLSSRKLMSAPYPMADSFCLDTGQSLEAWVQQHLSPKSENYQPQKAFNDYQAGDAENVSPDPLGVISGYSNLNAVVAAYIVERMTGKSFEEYCHDAIFEPCGMNQTSWSKEKPLNWMTHYEPEYSPRAPIMQVYTKAMLDQGYASKQTVSAPSGRAFIDFFRCDYYSPVYPMGLLGTSLTSILPFFLAHLDGGKVNGYQLLQPQTVRSIFTQSRKDSHTGNELGLGWFKNYDAKGNTIWGHDGGGPGIVSTAYISPVHGCGIVLFINNFHLDYRLRSKLIERMYEIAFSGD
ncbi:serine hydrolase domain-containing protein [Vibrio sonorensis]|uniref:serine hydrolase domain-containing protein n=1 Tax=Vibrio sonorensis TaxID=1004316 RepID=UPI0008D92646|nr:serine hydrolase [Vibrio sonorensis]